MFAPPQDEGREPLAQKLCSRLELVGRDRQPGVHMEERGEYLPGAVMDVGSGPADLLIPTVIERLLGFAAAEAETNELRFEAAEA